MSLPVELNASFSVQDLSYYCCIELQGEEEQLLAALSQLTSKDAGEGTLFFVSSSLFEGLISKRRR